MKSKTKYKKPKPRIKVAPPSKRHKSARDYDRKELKNELNKSIKEIGLDDVLEIDEVKQTPIFIKNNAVKDLRDAYWERHTSIKPSEELKEALKPKKSWHLVDYLMNIFGFKRKN